MPDEIFPTSPARESRSLVARVAVVLLGVLACAYLGKGFYILTQEPEQALDLLQRWRDQQYVLRGQNPFDVLFEARGTPWPEAAGRRAQQDPTLPPMRDVGYPPWAYFWGAILFWPPAWGAMVWSYAAWCAAGLILVSVWVWRWLRTFGRDWAAVGVAGWLACGSTCTTLGVGQIGILMAALMAILSWPGRKHHWGVDGMALGLALFKPHIAAPFVLAVLIGGRWKAVLLALGCCVVGGMAVWGMTTTDPPEMIRQMFAAGQEWAFGGVSLLSAAVALGLSPGKAFLTSTAISLAIGGWLFWTHRRASPLLLFAIAAVGTRLWTYHQGYDDLIVIFLFVALLRQTLTLRSLTAHRHEMMLLAAVTLAVGVSLWLPARLTREPVIYWPRYAIWVIGLIAMLWAQSRHPAALRADERTPTTGSPVPAP